MSEREGREPVPACKGCGSTNLRGLARAVIYSEYDEPTHVENGELHFATSYSGHGEDERWRIECGDCGRVMRTPRLAPVQTSTSLAVSGSCETPGESR
jgi:hypothetical protein